MTILASIIMTNFKDNKSKILLLTIGVLLSVILTT